jgi:hypothetical protein
MINGIAALGIKVDPRQAVMGSNLAKRAITGVGGAASKAKSAVFSLQGALIGIGAGATLRSIITTAAEVESLKIRLKFLTGSAEDAGTAFDVMNEYASKTPFALESIERASPSLLTVADDVGELNELLAITGDIAAVSGLTFDETAMQIQRAMSAGIASADQFRERGVSAFLGFEAGVSYSAEETKKRIQEMWRDGTTTAKGATSELAGTFTGQVSMMQDAWREMKLVVADTGVFEEAGNVIMGITEYLKDPAFKAGVESFSTNLLGLFGFIVENKTALIAVGSIYLGAKLGKAFGILGAAIGGATGALIAFNSEIKEFLGISDTSEIDIINSKINSTIEAMASLNGISAGNAVLKSSFAPQIKEHMEALARYRLQVKVIQEDMEVVKPEIKATVIGDTTITPFKKAKPKIADGSSHAILRLQNAHYKALNSAEKTHYDESVENTHLWLQKQSGIYKAATDDIETQWQEVGHAVQSSWDAVGSSVENTLADAILGISSWADATKSILRDVAREFVKTYILKGAVAGISGAIGGAFGLNSTPAPATGSLNLSNATYGLPGFDGGGFTGSGSRSGGVDGKGGFPAILHPNETVVDHTKGQSAGSGGKTVIVQQTINITTGVQQTVRAEISNLMPDIANATKSAVYEAQQRGAFG